MDKDVDVDVGVGVEEYLPVHVESNLQNADDDFRCLVVDLLRRKASIGYTSCMRLTLQWACLRC